MRRRRGASLDLERDPSRCDLLTAEPGDALLHEVDLEVVRARGRGERDLDQEARALPGADRRAELRADAVPREDRARWREDVVRGVDRAGLPHRGADVG